MGVKMRLSLSLVEMTWAAKPLVGVETPRSLAMVPVNGARSKTKCTREQQRENHP